MGIIHYQAARNDIRPIPVSPDDPLPTTGGGGGGGGGGAVTVANGADVTQGTIGDTQATGTVVGYLKSLWVGFFGTPVAIKVDGSAVTQPVSGTFFQATQPVSAAALPLPSGASTAAKQPALGTAGTPSADVISVQGVAGGTAQPVSGTFFQATQPVSAAALPLPANAAQETGGNLATLAGAITSSVVQENVKQINGVTPLMGNGVTGTGSQRVTLASDNSALSAAGQGATAATIPAGATQAGLRGATANPTAVTDGQMVGAMGDKLGRAVVVANGIRDQCADQKTTISNSTAETTIVTAIASVFADMLSLVLANTGATATKVDIRDTTGGSIRTTLYVPAGETRGIVFSTPLKQATVNTNWTAQCAAATTAMEVTAQFVKNS